MMQDQERILKSLSDKQNQRIEKPSTGGEFQEENEQHTDERNVSQKERSVSQRSHPNRNFNEAESENETEWNTSKKQKLELHGEFRKIKPPTFDGEKEEMAEAWLINMNKYFQVYEYDSGLKARLAIYQLKDKATLWWEEVRNVRGIEDSDVTWEKFQQYFKDKYLTERFYDEKAR